MSNKLRIVTIPADEYGSGHYRIINPSNAYNAQGNLEHEVVILPVGTSKQETIGLVQSADVVLYHRPCVMSQNDLVFENASNVIVDTDDTCDNLDPTNPAYFYYKNGGEGSKAYVQALKAAKGIINTTPYLASYNTRFNKINTVVPNYIDVSANWTPRTEGEPNTLRFGWFGSTSHAGDLKECLTAMSQLMSKYPFVRLNLMSDEAMLQHICDISIDSCHSSKVGFIKSADFASYNRGINYDFGLCPAVPNSFNDAKSNLKILEHAAKGIPSICSPILSYLSHPHRLITPEHTTASWFETLDYAVNNIDRMYEITEGAVRDLTTNYLLQDHTHVWIDAITSILSGEATSPLVARATRNSPCPCGSGLKYKRCCSSRTTEVVR